jgi:tetratricopeptide (TPR) repeat protein
MTTKEKTQKAKKYFEDGNKSYDQEDYNKAIEYYKQAINLNHNYVEAHSNLGFVYQNRGIYDMAIECYNTAIKLNPNLVRIYRNLKVIYTKMQNYEMAASCRGKEKELTCDYIIKGNNYEAKGDLKNAFRYYLKSDENSVLAILMCFAEDNRKKVIEKGFLNKLLDNDEYFKQVVDSIKYCNFNNVMRGKSSSSLILQLQDQLFKRNYKQSENDVHRLEKYKAVYIHSIYIISMLHINDENEKEVAYYTQKNIAEKMFFKGKNEEKTSRYRLNSINYSNDPTEGQVLLKFLFYGKGPIIKNTENPYRAFAGCFTFGYDSLNQFRLYGKEENKECTGVSMVFSNGFFGKSAKLATEIERRYKIKTIENEDNKHALFRCIYIDPKTNKVVSVGRKEEFLFYRNSKNIVDFSDSYYEYIKIYIENKSFSKKTENTDEIVKKYNQKIEELTNNVSEELKSLRKQINGLDENIVSQLLINLRYLTKHVAFKEEQECRIVKIENVKNDMVKTSENRKQMYLEYLEIGLYVEKIYFGPNASDMNIFQDRLLNEGLNIECKKSENPFA